MDRTVTPNGRRSSTARGYLDLAKDRPNLTIVTHATTNKILFNGKQAIGVEYIQSANQHDLKKSMPIKKCCCVRVQLRHHKSYNALVWDKVLFKINGY